MQGVIVNAAAVIIGGFVGSLLKNGIKKDYQLMVTQCIGLAVLVIGITGAIKTQNTVLVVVALVVGGLLGTFLKIEKNLDKLGKTLENRFSKNSELDFAKGIVTATLIFCVGSMSIIGSLNSGLYGDHSMIYVKSMMDCIVAMVLATTYGKAVCLASIPLFVYQGAIVLLSSFLAPYLSAVMLGEITAVGSVLIMGIGINMLEIKTIKTGDMLPALIVPFLFYLLVK